MVDFDIKSQLDLLNEYLDREMEAVKTEYFVVRPDGKRSGGNRPVSRNPARYLQTIVNGNSSTSGADGYGRALDRQLPPSRLCSWEAYRSNGMSFPHAATKKRSKAIDIIDPETGTRVQL